MAFWCLTFRAAAQQPVKFITLLGKSTHQDGILAYYQNEFQDQVPLHLKQDSTTGQYQPYKLLVSHPLWIQFANASEQYSVYAKPNDTIIVQANATRTPFYIFRSGKSSPARLAELNFFPNLLTRGLAIDLPDFAGSFINANYPRQAELFCRKFDQRVAWLYHQKDSLHFSKSFVTYAEQQMRAQYLQALFYPYWNKERIFMQFSSTYEQLLATSGAAQFLTTDSLVLSSPKYRSAAVSYVRYLSRDSVSTPAELAAQYIHAKKSLRGLTRDYVLFFLLKQHLGKDSPGYTTYFERFRRECATSAYIHYLDSVTARPTVLKTRPELLATSLRSDNGETLTWTQLLARNRGKVMYIDLWASWCAPCMAEMPASLQLQHRLAGQGVKFVYFSLDTDAAKWRKALTTYHLKQPNSQHYLLDSKSALAAFFKVPPIPRYLLVNKQGQVISLDASRPSNPLLISNLMSLLL